MRDPLRERVTAHQLYSTRRSRAAALLLILSLLVTGNVFWNLRQTGIAMAGDAACGMEEHTHTVDCYATAPICGLDFSAGSGAEITEPVTLDQPSAEPVLICEEEHPHTEDCYALPQAEEASPISDVPSMEPHTHTSQCYDSDPVCGKQAHVHSITCYSDLTADVETPLDWQSMFAGVVTGDLAQDLVTVAQSQVGYSESQLNFQVDDLGQRRGYTRYGAWYGFPYEDWSAMFVSFCLSYAGSTTQQTPFNIGVGSMMQLWQQQGQYADSSYLPLPGDLVFFSDSTVGILSEVSEGSLRVIQGDWQDAVCQRSISSADSTILGYGIVTVQQPAVEDAPSQPDEEPEVPPQPNETPVESTPDAENDPENNPEITPDSDPDGEDTPISSPETPNLLGASTTLSLPDCDCPQPAPADLAKHPATCARQYYLTVLASEKSAQELYTLWPQLPTDCQDYVLSFLEANPDTADKLEDLNDLLVPESGTLNADCGGSSFTLSGKVPAGAALTVAEAGYSRETLLETCFNRNDWDYINRFWIYDIAITVGGTDWQPQEPVQLTVTNSEFAPTEGEFFCVAHLDADGNVLSTDYLTPENGAVTFTASSFSPYLFYTIEKESQGGEKVTGTNWMTLRDSDWFTYWEQFLTDTSQSETDTAVPAAAPAAASATAAAPFAAAATTDQIGKTEDPSDVQIDKIGGPNTSEPDGLVEVSKTIDGTELENVFDITLTVETQQNIQEVYRQRDLSVVIVMDISNTMTEDFGETTRYKAAMESAEHFLDEFTKKTSDNSKIGYVAFNTDAHQIFGLQTCSTTEKANTLKDTMRKSTGSIINQSGYAESSVRFTNMEAGLKMAQDMLDKSTSESKYIIFLSDGFPTTYLNYNASGYKGYDPYDKGIGTPGTDGVFHDDVIGVYCLYGTSYSDKAAIRAHAQADAIKKSGIKIFSIGVDVAGQTITKYDTHVKKDGFSIIDRTGTSYELGGPTDTDAFKNWLGNSIGSGFYYDSTKQDELTAAYDEIFSEITLSGTASQGEWVTRDPLPGTGSNNQPEQLEFIGFYGKDGKLRGDPEKGAFQLNGTAAENGENTAVFDPQDSEISWDLKQSGYTSKTHADGTTTYFYQLTYRVRLKNEWDGFVEKDIYDTNNPTSLTYRVIEVNGQTSIPSEPRTVEYPIPAVHGYLGELVFRKTDPGNQNLAGAEFTLTHDTADCGNCRGDGLNPVALPDCTAASDENGQVSFTSIPSGHVYTLTETKPPPGYLLDHNTYTVTVAYDKVTVTRNGDTDPEFVWNGVLINYPTTYELPATGGSGVWPWLLTGSALITGSLAAQLLRRKRRKPPPVHL